MIFCGGNLKTHNRKETVFCQSGYILCRNNLIGIAFHTIQAAVHVIIFSKHETGFECGVRRTNVTLLNNAIRVQCFKSLFNRHYSFATTSSEVLYVKSHVMYIQNGRKKCDHMFKVSLYRYPVNNLRCFSNIFRKEKYLLLQISFLVCTYLDGQYNIFIRKSAAIFVEKITSGKTIQHENVIIKNFVIYLNFRGFHGLCFLVAC